MTKTLEVRSKDFSRLFRTSDELIEKEEGVIEGEIPDWLNGTFIRNGPAKFDIGPNFTLNHWLDGYTLLSKFEIKNGKEVTFQKKFLKSDAHEKAMAAKKNIYAEFGTKGSPDPAKNVFSRFASTVLPIDLSDNCNSSIAQFGQDLFTLMDTCYMRRVNCDLDTCEKIDTNKLFGLNGVTSHPLQDKRDGSIYNIGFSAGMGGMKFNVLKIPAGTKYKEMMDNAKIIASIPSRWSTAISGTHSFGMTDRYIVLIEQPHVSCIPKLATVAMKGNGMKDVLEWRGGKGETNRFILIEKKTGKIFKTIYFSKDPFFFLHVINCFEEGNEVIIDLVAYKSPSVLENLYLKNLRACKAEFGDPPTAQRFRLPLVDLRSSDSGVIGGVKDTSTVTMKVVVHPEILTGSGLDGPTINRNFLGDKYNYFYAVGTVCENEFVNGIVKVNVETRKTIFWRDPAASGYPGEAIFIPNPKNAKISEDKSKAKMQEDDGILVSAVTDRKDHHDYLVFIDATTMVEVGRVKFSTFIPPAVHGLFLQDSGSGDQI